jgi:hypothetical protein
MLSNDWQEMVRQRDAIDKKMKAQKKKERAAALPLIRKQCRELGITAAMLKGALKTGRTPSTTAKSKS